MKIVHFADLHLGVENYGRIDPATGLSSRLVDFLAAFDQLVAYALENGVDLVLFCGDAYKTREPTQTQQREFARRIDRLSRGGIPVFLLIGNHDMPNAVGRATATEIFDTLSVKNVYVANKPDIYNIPTAAGPLQVAALPWLRRSALLSREDSRNLTLEAVNRKMQQTLTEVVASLAARLDPALPAVLAAHVLVGDAKVGRSSESLMSVGQEPALLLSNVANPAFDYVALGHIHKHQVLAERPPVVYAGSLERVDFGEENDDKGFYLVDIEPGPAPALRQVAYNFHPVTTRRFLTIDVTAVPDDLDVTATVLRSISSHAEKLQDAIVRLRIGLPEAMETQLRGGEIRDALKTAHYCTVAREVQRETRRRMGDLAAADITPLSALEKWLDTQHVSPERRRTLMEYGEKLLRADEPNL
jgi:DNA repair protein SbcD/Mre11